MSSTEVETASAWIFKGNPAEWRLDDYLADLRAGEVSPDVAWLVTRFEDRIKKGDRVYLWRASGKDAAIVAVARAVGPVSELEDDKPEYRQEGYEDKYAGARPRAPLFIEHILSRPLTRVAMQHNAGLADELASLSIFRWYTEGTQYPVQPNEEAVLDRECLDR